MKARYSTQGIWKSMHDAARSVTEVAAQAATRAGESAGKLLETAKDKKIMESIQAAAHAATEAAAKTTARAGKSSEKLLDLAKDQVKNVQERVISAMKEREVRDNYSFWNSEILKIRDNKTRIECEKKGKIFFKEAKLHLNELDSIQHNRLFQALLLEVTAIVQEEKKSSSTLGDENNNFSLEEKVGEIGSEIVRIAEATVDKVSQAAAKAVNLVDRVAQGLSEKECIEWENVTEQVELIQDEINKLTPNEKSLFLLSKCKRVNEDYKKQHDINQFEDAMDEIFKEIMEAKRMEGYRTPFEIKKATEKEKEGLPTNYKNAARKFLTELTKISKKSPAR